MDYLYLSLRLSRGGTVILEDSVIRHGRVPADQPDDEAARSMRDFNTALAASRQLKSIILPIVHSGLDGISLSIVK